MGPVLLLHLLRVRSLTSTHAGPAILCCPDVGATLPSAAAGEGQGCLLNLHIGEGTRVSCAAKLNSQLLEACAVGSNLIVDVEITVFDI